MCQDHKKAKNSVLALKIKTLAVVWLDPSKWNSLRLSDLSESSTEYLNFILFGVNAGTRMTTLACAKKVDLWKLVESQHYALLAEHPQRLQGLAHNLTNVLQVALALGMPRKYIHPEDLVDLPGAHGDLRAGVSPLSNKGLFIHEVSMDEPVGRRDVCERPSIVAVSSEAQSMPLAITDGVRVQPIRRTMAPIQRAQEAAPTPKAPRARVQQPPSPKRPSIDISSDADAQGEGGIGDDVGVGDGAGEDTVPGKRKRGLKRKKRVRRVAADTVGLQAGVAAEAVTSDAQNADVEAATAAKASRKRKRQLDVELLARGAETAACAAA